MRILAIAAAIVTTTTATLMLAQQTPSTPVPPLSPPAMDALVASVAFYPDAVIEQILDAVQYPDAIKFAAAGTAAPADQEKWPPSVRLLTTHPEILQQLDQNAVVTARLALAARTQLADVWAAIDRVRQQFESQSQETTAGTTSNTVAASGVVYPTGAFLAGFWTAQVVDEIGVWYAATAPVAAAYGHGTATVTGPGGNSATIAAAGGAAAITVGDTTYFGAAGQGTVETSNGTVVSGQGQVTGSATKTAEGGSYQTQASGSVSSNTGKSAQGEHSASGSYQTNPDGSVDFERSAETNASSTGGSTKVEHSGSGTITGDGTGSYSGSTDIDSTRGDASVDTTAAKGEITSTITTPKGEKSVTLGDQQVNAATSDGAQRAKRQATASSMARPTSVPPTDSRFRQPSAQQWQSASRSLADSWSGLSKGTKGFSGTNSMWASRAGKTGSVGSPAFARPNTGTLGSRNGADAARMKNVQPPTRKPGNTPNRAPSGKGRGRR